MCIDIRCLEIERGITHDWVNYWVMPEDKPKPKPQHTTVVNSTIMPRIIPHTGAMIRSAQTKARLTGELNGSVTKGEGGPAGFLGEEAVAAYMGGELISFAPGQEKYNHDMMLNGKRWEIKTKRRSVAPKPSYDCSIGEWSHHQRPDTYVFLSVELAKTYKDTSGILEGQVKNVWLLGSKSYDDYFNQARFIHEGDIDPSNGFQCSADMYNITIGQLDPVVIGV